MVLGVLGCPNLDGGLLMAAVREKRGGGGGGTRGGTRQLPVDGTGIDGPAVHVSSESEPSAMRFCESVESGHSDQDASVRIAQELGITAEPQRIDSQCKYAAVARGDASIYLRLPTRPGYREKIWDHAAGSIVVEEAGGRVTDIHGRPLDFSRGRTLENNHGIIASSGAVHDRVVEVVKAVVG